MKIAVVSGASYGLGRAIAEKLLKKSFKVYGISRSDPKISSDNFVWLRVDLLDEDEIKKNCTKISESKIDLLINNAGTVILEKSIEFSDKNFDKLFGLNFVAPIKLTSILGEKLHNGLIINISSTSDRFAEENYALYCASKSAFNIYFDAIAIENQDIKVINLLPSYIDTPLQRKLAESDFDWSMTMDASKVAESITYIWDKREQIETTTRVIVINNKTLDDTQDPEKLYYYNVDTSEFKKVK